MNNFHSLEVVNRGSEKQLQMDESSIKLLCILEVTEKMDHIT